MERLIDTIIIHCSATPDHMDIGVDWIRKKHMKERGWRDVGYHAVIRRDGTVEWGRDKETIGAHTKGFNATSLGVCLIGTHQFTNIQMAALKTLLTGLCSELDLFVDAIRCHYEYNNNKTCPNINRELIRSMLISSYKIKEEI